MRHQVTQEIMELKSRMRNLEIKRQVQAAENAKELDCLMLWADKLEKINETLNKGALKG